MFSEKNEAKPSLSISPTSNRLVRVNLFIMVEISSSQTPFHFLDQRDFIYYKNEKIHNEDKIIKKATKEKLKLKKRKGRQKEHKEDQATGKKEK